MTEPYVPLRERGLATPAPLAPGVPSWLSEPLIEWLAPLLHTDDGVGALALTVHVALPPRSVHRDFKRTFLNQLRQDPRAHLLAIEAVLGTGMVDDTDVTSLDALLERGGSAYLVALDRRALATRVPRPVANAAEAAVGTGGHAGAHLAQAWSACYAREPNPTQAYSLAIKAVEDAAIPLLEPTNAKATLGSVLGELRGNARQTWRLPIAEAAGEPPTATLVALMQRLWQGQTDRHGGPPPLVPVTQAQAEQAVGIAVQLVQLFGSGAVTHP